MFENCCCNEVLCELCSMGLSIVLLQNSALMRSNEWKHNRVQTMANVRSRRNPATTSLPEVKEHDLLFVQPQRSISATHGSVNPSPSVDMLPEVARFNTESTLIGVHTLLWPALSPGLNSIEQVWDHMKSKIRAQNVNNVHQLQQAIIDEWNKLPVKFLHRRVRSMRQRCTEVIRVNGHQFHC